MTVELPKELKAMMEKHPEVNMELAETVNNMMKTLFKEADVGHAVVICTKEGVSYGGAPNKNLGLTCMHLMNVETEGVVPGLMVQLVRALSDYLNAFEPELAGTLGRMLVVHNDGNDIAEFMAECVAEAISEEKPALLH